MTDCLGFATFEACALKAEPVAIAEPKPSLVAVVVVVVVEEEEAVQEEAVFIRDSVTNEDLPNAHGYKSRSNSSSD